MTINVPLQQHFGDAACPPFNALLRIWTLVLSSSARLKTIQVLLNFAARDTWMSRMPYGSKLKACRTLSLEDPDCCKGISMVKVFHGMNPISNM